MAEKLLSILGPTASGKSAVALELARRGGGEIVSCDSMMIYRGLDIGTAKPTPADRREVPHHLLDILEFSEPYNASRFQRDADAAIRAIIARGKQPILCGGTGLYARALLYGFAMWPRDPEVAAALRREFAAGNAETLLAELRAAAPELASRLEHNPRHWLRALEVLRLTGEPPRDQQDLAPPPYAAPEFVLMPGAELSRKRIRHRTEAMFREGWLEETKSLVEKGLLTTPTASQALGYVQLAQYLDGEIPSLAELTDEIVKLTCRYAKRQRTWFRRQHPNAIIIPVKAADTPAALTARILNAEY